MNPDLFTLPDTQSIFVFCPHLGRIMLKLYQKLAARSKPLCVAPHAYNETKGGCVEADGTPEFDGSIHASHS